MSAFSKRSRFRAVYWGLLGLIGVVLALGVQGDRAHAALPQASSVSINMSNPSCVQVSQANGVCAIQLPYLVASGSDPSFSRLEVLVNGKLRLYEGGFFESIGYFTYQMLPGGLKVVCGKPNASGNPDYGKIYPVTVNAYMADGASASDSMNVACPAFEARIFLPSIKKK